MESKQASQFPRHTVDQLLAAVPFYKTVKQQDLWQFDMLLQHSRVVSFAPGEVVLKCGERDSWLYFLLKGQLAVYVGEEVDGEPVNYITPGEVFGDLAMLVDEHRTATLIADSNSKRVMAFGTDFTVFGDLDDFRTISLHTKLAYYRNTVHSLRWKLEVYRVKYPYSTLAADHRKIKLFSGKPGSYEELSSLYQQAKDLAQLIVNWNREFGALSMAEGGVPNPKLVASME